MVLGGKMEMIDVRNSFILKNKKRKKSLFLFSSFLRDVMVTRSLFCQAEQTKFRTDVNENRIYVSVCSFRPGESPMPYISISSVAIKNKTENTCTNQWNVDLFKATAGFYFHRFSWHYIATYYLFYAQKS